ncbi:MAG: HAD family hydrolase [Acholeplasmataceae bacterium]
MEKHLIAIDLDGTLLDSNSEISNENKEVIKTLSNLGHMVVLATGRPYHATIDYYYELELKTPVITDNGGNIREPLNNNFQTVVDGIPVLINHKLFNFTKPFLESAFYSYGKYVYAYNYLERLHKIFMGSEKANIIHEDFDKLMHTPTGMIYLVKNEFLDDFENFLKTELNEEVNFRLWGKDSKHGVYEIYKKGSSKLSAINWIRKHFNINEDNVISFGDGINDIEMIGGVKLGVAVSNAHESVKEKAKYLSPYSNDENAVALFLKEYFKL